MIQHIEQAENIAVVTHENPDPDAIGSALAISNVIKKRYPNKDISFFVSNPIVYDVDTLLIKPKISKFVKCDLLITLDSVSFERLDVQVEAKFVINIDHHISNKYFGDINIVNIEECSTSSLLINIFEEYGLYYKHVSNLLYMGISSDTGNFAWNVSNALFKKVAKLDADMAEISRKLFYEKSLGHFKLLGYVLNNFIYDEKLGLIYSYISEKIFKELEATVEDREGIIDFLKSLKGIKVALLLREEGNTIKGSLRSFGYDVNSLANCFAGGGHKNAAGFTSTLAINEIIYKIKEYMEGK